MQLAWGNILDSLGMTAEEVWRERSQFQGLELSYGESSTSVLMLPVLHSGMSPGGIFWQVP